MQCPVCRKQSAFKEIEKRGPYTIRECLACRVVFSDPMKNPGGRWYDEDSLYKVGKYLFQGLSWHHKQFFRSKVPGRTLLDVGCGEGGFLNEAQKHDYLSWGLDFSKENIKLAKERYNLTNISSQSIEQFSRTAKKKFNIVTAFEILEHMDDPASFIQRIKKLLQPNGLICVSVPNRGRMLDTVGERDYPPHHLTRWNSGSLRGFLENQGFEVVRMVVHPLDWHEVNTYLRDKVRFGLAAKVAGKGLEQHNQNTVQRARTMVHVKNIILGTVSVPLMLIAYILRLFRLGQGSGLFCVAKLKQGTIS